MVPGRGAGPAGRGGGGSPGGRKRQLARHALLDPRVELLPLFRLADSADNSPIVYDTPTGGRWRVHPPVGDRLPGTFDQDVYVEIMRRYNDAGLPDNGVVRFTLHSFLRSLGRRVDGRAYIQLRGALTRLERTVLESYGVLCASDGDGGEELSHFSLLSSVSIERRRDESAPQLPLFDAFSSAEPGEARVVVGRPVRSNLVAGQAVSLDIATYMSLQSPVARRLYRVLLASASTAGESEWGVAVPELARILPLTQRFPSQLFRVLDPAHEMLITAGVLRAVHVSRVQDVLYVQYALVKHPSGQPEGGDGGRELA